ncbi:MAG: Do family serine endopeptidase [Nitrospira sp.]|nr:Do family serine endopeptidase [Nitrospira sp.]MDH4245481.1 Do family serine endopeptidase [Nitrospira sp.]MDH4356407.1 Do family serine endopeptidase [Nitrospira sp.]MDH5319678.1 Do family serine endopeptidase [Nitrospira sp.]
MIMLTSCSARVRQFLFSTASILLFVTLETRHAEAFSADSPGIRMLEEIQTVITELAEETKHSVVNLFPITSGGRSRETPGERMPNASGSGSGLIVDGDGHIVTNNHVIGDATEIEVRLSDKTRLTAHVVGKDPDTDLALLKVSAGRPLASARFGDSTGVKVGQWVLAVGNPFGLDQSVTLGVVSGIGRENINLSRYENFIQTDASINPGNSGGPLFNLRGEVIGINTAIINFAQGIGFAIPSNMAKQVIEQLLAKGRVVRGWLGVGIQPLTAELAKKFGVTEGGGVLVNEVFEKDPAALAGIQPGDVIVRINGVVVESPNKLSRLIGTLAPGATSQIEVVRDLKHLLLNIPLTERPDSPVLASIPRIEKLESKLGLEVQESTAGLVEKFRLRQSKGVVITKVEPNSLAQAEGLREGDLIIEVNRTEVSSLGEFTSTISQSRRGDALLLRVLRENRAFYVVLKPIN